MTKVEILYLGLYLAWFLCFLDWYWGCDFESHAGKREKTQIAELDYKGMASASSGRSSDQIPHDLVHDDASH